MNKTFVLTACALLLGANAFAQTGTNAAYQQKAGAAATAKANKASLKKGEPALKMNTTTTTTNVYDVSSTNKRGTTNYGVVEQTVTNAQGTTSTGGIVYQDYTPSKAALTNEKRREFSLAGGMAYSFNEDDRKDRYGTSGFAAGASMLWYMTPNFAMGLDYMMLHPNKKTHIEGTSSREYHANYLHAISFGGKYTINAWDNLRVYMPMGVGMMNARMKTRMTDTSTSKDKWGAGMYAGLGLQYDITTSLFAGLEYRYTYAFINDKHLSDFNRDKNMQYHSAFLRLGMRF